MNIWKITNHNLLILKIGEVIKEVLYRINKKLMICLKEVKQKCFLKILHL